MIQLQTLKYLVKTKVKDSEVLYANNRFPAAVYLAGYAAEIALKYKICVTLNFSGFPETRQELAAELKILNQASVQSLTLSITDIRNHDLPKLLRFSGIEYRVKNRLFKEWITVSTWNPENRYKKVRVLQMSGESYIKSVKKIIKEIM